ncbi:PilZ domain-containing protein [Rhizobium sp. FY34]|uniref:PilZ domain-containing protein n=1 Tax=Rhizobium sp. FY34 TaxID=2562309 RepID=UPI0010C05FF6|nr:PilZ domain-containing protein [Rhizobium sp. FY34]
MHLFPGIKARKAERKRTRITGTVRYGMQHALGRVIDLSAVGMALDLEKPLHAAIGSRIRVESEALGLIEGTVQWCHGARLGVQFDRSSNAFAKVASYFRFFHRETRPLR